LNYSRHSLGLHASHLRRLVLVDDGLSVEELLFLDLGAHFVDALHDHLVHLLGHCVSSLEVAVEGRRRQVPFAIVGDPRSQLGVLGSWARALEWQLGLLLGRHRGFHCQLERRLCLREWRLASCHGLGLGREGRLGLGESIDEGLELEPDGVHSQAVVVLCRHLALGVGEYRVLEVLDHVVHLGVPLLLVVRVEPVLVYVGQALVLRVILLRPLVEEVLLLQDRSRVYERVDTVNIVALGDGHSLPWQPPARLGEVELH